MKREEEINIAKNAFYDNMLKDGHLWAYNKRDCFEEGAKWADANPKNPWISVEDDLPCNHEELITTNGRYEKNTIYVITIDKYGIIESNYMVLYDDGKWEWKYSLPAPCYWMLIPKLPKESEIDLTVY